MIMKATKITLGFILFLLVIGGNAIVSITAMCTALGWLYYEESKSFRYGKKGIH